MCHDKTEIYIDGKEYDIQPGLTQGETLHQLAGTSGSEQLLLEVHDDIDIPVSNDDLIIISGEERFSVGNGEPPIADNPCLRKPITFWFNGEQKSLTKPKLTDLELKELDADCQAGDGLFAELHDLADYPIDDKQRVVIQNDNRFITTPCGNVGYAGEGQMPLTLHFEELKRVYPSAELHDGTAEKLVVIRGFPLPDHWSQSSTDILIRVPNGYPMAGLDMFWVNPSISTASGTIPEAATEDQEFLDQSWQRFSWHYSGRQWIPAKDNLLSHVRFCQARLAENK